MIQVLHGLAYTSVALWLLTSVGNIACRRFFAFAQLGTQPTDNDGKEQQAGRIIGWLERLLLAIGIVFQSWEVLAAVIALKSVARFKELNDRNFAEYFLVGSLFSILWALLISSSWIAYDRHLGADIRADLATLKDISLTAPARTSP